jgi:hypothetical protein
MWKAFMTAAHTSPDIPQLPGLPLNPNQVAAMQQLAAAQAADPSLQHKKDANVAGGLSDRMREVLKSLAGTMKQAAVPGATVGGGAARRAETQPKADTHAALASTGGDAGASATP